MTITPNDATIAWLNKHLGLSHGKVQKLLEQMFGVTISRSTSCRSMQKTAQRCETARKEAKKLVRGSPVIVADETGWRMNGESAWLHAFTSPVATVYEIDKRRNSDPLADLIGFDWSGVLVHDGWRVYDTFTRAEHQQCLAHLLRRSSELLEQAVGGAVRFPRAVKKLLKRSLVIRDRHRLGELTFRGVAVLRGRLQAELDRLVGPNKSNESNERFARFLRRHRDDLFTFLAADFLGLVDATNWRAEQAIRPAVVNRKVWGGNRTPSGAEAQATLMTVLVTLAQQRTDTIQWIANARRATESLGLAGLGR